jgi:hypothetical protein
MIKLFFFNNNSGFGKYNLLPGSVSIQLGKAEFFAELGQDMQ